MPYLPDAHVIETGQGCFRVNPGVAPVKHDDGFDLRNVTGWWLTLQFPEGVLTADDRLSARTGLLEELFPAKVVELLAKAIRWVAPGKTIHLDLAPGVEGVYDYAVTVYTDRGPTDAPGNSAPKIIIDA